MRPQSGLKVIDRYTWTASTSTLKAALSTTVRQHPSRQAIAQQEAAAPEDRR
jgi:hypothetical protein